MPEALLLALPIVGGFLAATRLHLSRFSLARNTGYRFYFKVVYYAILLVAGAIALAQGIWVGAAWSGALMVDGPTPDGMLWSITASSFQSFKANQWQIAILAFGAGELAHKVVNFPPGTEERHISKAIESQDFERMAEKALTENKPIAITLKSSQVYVGWAVRGPNPALVRRWIRILPLASGFRDEHQRMNLRINYAPTLKSIRDEDPNFRRVVGDHIQAEDFEVVLSLDEITGMHLFDLDVYRLFDPQGAQLFEDSS